LPDTDAGARRRRARPVRNSYSRLLALPFLSTDAIADTTAAYASPSAPIICGWRQQPIHGAAWGEGQLHQPRHHRHPDGAGRAGQPGRLGPASDDLRIGTGRQGTAADIAAAAEFLTSPHATFITGTDLLDGGAVAAIRNGRVDLGQK
jgi:NAD(P)-dependent dehydrogenase (short-subunit alcohol dehydrogenase family)